MNTLTPKQQQTILKRTLTTIGHPAKHHEDLMLMFYTGMLTEFKDNQNISHLESSLENFMNSPEDKDTATQLLEVWNLLESHNIDREITDAFNAYLNRYINHLRPDLTQKQTAELEKILKDTSKLMNQTA